MNELLGCHAARLLRRAISAKAEIDKLVRDRKGSMLINFGFLMVPLVLVGGMVIDLGRAYTVKSRLTYALDAAGLAVGSSQGTEEELQNIMESYFYANYPNGEIGGVPATPHMSITGAQIELSATAEMDTTIMRIFGLDELEVAGDVKIMRETKGFEVALVLDNTGSMRSGGKMDDLIAASTEMVNIIYGPEESLEDVWMAVVPYTATVNVGPGRANWLASGDQFFDSPSPFSPSTWKGCVEARPSPFDEGDAPPSFQPFTSYLYESASDNDWPPIDETNEAQNDGTGPNLGCGPEITPLVGERQTVQDAIDEMQPWHRGGTTGNLGLVWGWRIISPRWRGLWGGDTPNELPLDYDEDLMEKAVVMMTDGQNQFYDWPGNGPGPDGSDYTAYGRLFDFGFSTLNDARQEIDDRFATTCQAMKDEGIVMYTITFGSTPNSSTQDLYADCATNGRYWHAPDGDTLTAAFEQIGNELSNLRISQ